MAIVTAYCLVGISAWTLFGSQLEGAFGSNRFRAMALPVAGFILVLLGILAGIGEPSIYMVSDQDVMMLISPR